MKTRKLIYSITVPPTKIYVGEDGYEVERLVNGQLDVERYATLDASVRTLRPNRTLSVVVTAKAGSVSAECRVDSGPGHALMTVHAHSPAEPDAEWHMVKNLFDQLAGRLLLSPVDIDADVIRRLVARKPLDLVRKLRESKGETVVIGEWS